VERAGKGNLLGGAQMGSTLLYDIQCQPGIGNLSNCCAGVFHICV
jgi:hypothetical protein